MSVVLSTLDKPFVTVDTETTGLLVGSNEVIELAVVNDSGVLFHSLIKPVNIETAHPDALRISGYNERDWFSAPTFVEVADKINDVLMGKILVGHNIGFDIRMLEAEMKKHNKFNKWAIDRRGVDTTTLALEHLQPLGLKRANLEEVAFFLGLSEELDRGDGGRHSALADAKVTHAVFNRLMRPNPAVLALLANDYHNSYAI